MQLSRIVLVIAVGGIFLLDAMQAPEQSRLEPGIYLSELVNNSDKSFKISSIAIEFDADIFGFRAAHDDHDDYIVAPLQDIGPQKKRGTRHIVQIPCAVGVRDGQLLAGAQLKIESSDSEVDEHYWLIRKWNMDGSYEFNVKRRPSKGEKLVQISHERKSFAADKRLITFVKIMVEKPNLVGIKVSTQTSEYTPQFSKD